MAALLSSDSHALYLGAILHVKNSFDACLFTSDIKDSYYAYHDMNAESRWVTVSKDSVITIVSRILHKQIPYRVLMTGDCRFITTLLYVIKESTTRVSP